MMHRAVVFTILSLAVPAFAAPTYLMGVLGDSISAATFADSTANAGHGREIPFLGNKENKDTLSFASGRNIRSHVVRLREKVTAENGKLEVLNVSVPGEVATGLLAQAKQLRDAMATGKYAALRYVTFFIGSNDACKRSSEGTMPYAEVETELRAAFAELAAISQPEPVRVLVVGIPRIPDLGTEEIRKMTTALGLSCEYVRTKMLKFCVPLTTWSNADDYAVAMKAVEETNGILARETDRARREHPSLELRFTGKIFETPIQPEWLAADCFHPNKKGHEEIAERLWGEQPWF